MMRFDPDGQVKNATVTDGMSIHIMIFLYTNGRVRTFQNIEPNTKVGANGMVGTANPAPNTDPMWFSWE